MAHLAIALARDALVVVGVCAIVFGAIDPNRGGKYITVAGGMGDSISITNGDGTSYFTQWANNSSLAYINLKSTSGVRCDEVQAAQLPTFNGVAGYNTVLLGCGTNDCGQAFDSAANIAARISTMVATLQAQGKRVFLMNLPPSKTAAGWDAPKLQCLADVNTAIALIAATCRVDINRVLDVDGDGIIDAGFDQGDHQHPNSTGKATLAAVVKARCGPP